MTTQPSEREAAALPPAGWYEDRQGPGERYWDGQRWSEHRRALDGAPLSAPPYRAPAASSKKTNVSAVASAVLGFFWIFWLGSFLAIFLGHSARRQIARSEGQEGGDAFAVIGLVFGYIGLAVPVLVLSRH